ncbi:MAG TPA: NlpC/P60 family protein [Bacteroidota bacterium]|nr:NlpC/P60 family protein [Bacteroidota bacterium]
MTTARLSFVIGVLFLFIGCASFETEENEIKAAVATLKEQFAPDRRVAVFDVGWERQAGGLVVKGEVEKAEAKQAVLAAIEKITDKLIIDSIRVLPDPALGEKHYGIVTVSVGNMRTKPSQAAELGTQVLIGMIVKLLKEDGGWYYVQSADRYLGWIEDDALHVTDQAGIEAWARAPKVIMTQHFGIIREGPRASADPVSDIVAGGMLKKLREEEGWIRVELPDKSVGYIERSMVQDYTKWRAERRVTAETIETAAKSFLGVPYLWGGTSAKGMDCSGFTKTIFRLNGMELNRDANQQATMGEEVFVGDDFEGLRKGDLVFFGRKASTERPERITHVGIYLSNKEYIHAPGGSRVRINSFDPTAPNYHELLRKSFVRARRVIPSYVVKEVG